MGRKGVGLRLFTLKKRKLQGDEMVVFELLCAAAERKGWFSVSAVVGMRMILTDI